MLKKPTLGLCLMVKDEKRRILVTLESCKDIADCFIILDTGSIDNTKEIITNFCDNNKIKLYMKEEKFVDFSTSRNVLLDFADDKADYLLQLDCNDEVRNGKNLREFIDNYKGDSSGFYVCQNWWSGVSLDKYYNVRLIKTKHQWRYKCPVHEYIINPEAEKNLAVVHRISGDVFTIYQDRTLDDDKSSKRFARDKELLYNEYIKNPKEPRTLFYLAQTCACLNKFDESFRYYKLRLEEQGFVEEIFQSYLRCGELSKMLNHSWEETIVWYIKALEYSEKVFKNPRVEPLIAMAEYYYINKKWQMAYLFCRRAIELEYPEDAVLFVNKYHYDYTRYHLMGIIGFYVNQLDLGRDCCLKAIENSDKDIDKENLKFYIPNEKERKDTLDDLKKNGIMSVLTKLKSINIQKNDNQTTIPGTNIKINDATNESVSKTKGKKLKAKAIRQLRKKNK